MKAVILCAGMGTRLGDLVTDVPKPMLPIGKKTILEHTILYLKQYGFKEIAINLHYLPEIITKHFDNGEKYSIKINYSYETKLRGTAGALIPLADWLGDDDFLVVYGDILTNQDLNVLINKHKEENAFATLLLHKRKRSNSIVKLDENHQVVKFLERPDPEMIKKYQEKNNDFWVNSGIQVLSKKALSLITRTNAFDLPRDIYVKVCSDQEIYGVPLTGERIAIDSPDRYEEAKRIFSY